MARIPILETPLYPCSLRLYSKRNPTSWSVDPSIGEMMPVLLGEIVHYTIDHSIQGNFTRSLSVPIANEQTNKQTAIIDRLIDEQCNGIYLKNMKVANSNESEAPQG